MIFGIIVDTFSELRSLHEERDFELLNKCFICGIDRRTFDKKGVNFNTHLFQNHDLWNYVYFLIYCYQIDTHKLTGYNYFVRTKFAKKATSWLPINKTIYLGIEDEKKDKFGELQNKMKKMQDNIFDYIDKKFDELADTLNDKLSQAGT